MKSEVDQEIEKLNTSLQSYQSSRNTEAVNRLALLSLIVGAGAVLTGFFGMNFGRAFGRIFFEPDASTLGAHYLAVAVVSILVVGAFAFGLYLVASNWSDYRDVLVRKRNERDQIESSLKRGRSDWPTDDEEFE